MSSFATSSPVSASTRTYRMRWPVFLLIWLNEIFSVSEVAGYSATGQVTRDRRRKPFQLARGAIRDYSDGTRLGLKTIPGSLFRRDRRVITFPFDPVRVRPIKNSVLSP